MTVLAAKTYVLRGYTCLVLLFVTFFSEAQSKINTNATSQYFGLNKVFDRSKSAVKDKSKALEGRQAADAKKLKLESQLVDELLAKYKISFSDLTPTDSFYLFSPKHDTIKSEATPSKLSIRDSLTLKKKLLYTRLNDVMVHSKLREELEKNKPEGISDAWSVDRARWKVDSSMLVQQINEQLKPSGLLLDSAALESELDKRLKERLALEQQQENQLLSRFRKEDFLEKSTEYFDHGQLSTEAQHIIKKAKKKENTQSFFKELIQQRTPRFDSLSTMERFNGGMMFELSDNLKSAHLSPFLEFEVTSKVILGVGTDLKFSLHPQVNLVEKSGRGYTQYLIKKYLLHGEVVLKERPASEHQRSDLQTNYLIGVGRQFTFLRKLTGKILLLYRINNNENQKFTLRYGFQLF